MNLKEFKECHHIKNDGQKCHSPAMRGSSYCYFHARDRRRQFRREPDGDLRLDISSLNSRSEILSALNQIMNALANGQISSRRASAMLYAVQMAQKEIKESPAPPFDLAELFGLSSNSVPEPRNSPPQRSIKLGARS